MPGGSTFDPLTPATGAATKQTSDHQWVVLHSLGVFEKVLEDLIVPGGRQLEPLADERLLGTGLSPPTPLEVEDRSVALGDRHRRHSCSQDRWKHGPPPVSPDGESNPDLLITKQVLWPLSYPGGRDLGAGTPAGRTA